LPRWHAAKGVLDYREAARREFPRSVAFSTQFSSIRIDEWGPAGGITSKPFSRKRSLRQAWKIQTPLLTAILNSCVTTGD
jgi:hypothetical protein